MHQTLYFKWVHFIVGNLYLNKYDFFSKSPSDLSLLLHYTYIYLHKDNPIQDIIISLLYCCRGLGILPASICNLTQFIYIPVSAFKLENRTLKWVIKLKPEIFYHNIIKTISEYLLPNKIKYIIIKIEERVHIG